MKTFLEEREVTRALVNEWYENIKRFQTYIDAVFSEKSKEYDVSSPVWERVEFPMGFIQEFRKKVDRLKQMFDGVDTMDIATFEHVNWKYVFGELIDVCNYARMCAGIAMMLLERFDISWDGEDK